MGCSINIVRYFSMQKVENYRRICNKPHTQSHRYIRVSGLGRKGGGGVGGGGSANQLKNLLNQ